jgi:hypothetical protein
MNLWSIWSGDVSGQASNSVVAAITISRTQDWTSNQTAGAVASLSKAYVSVPTAGNLLVCYGGCSNSTTITVPTDDINDGGAWAAVAFPSPLAEPNDLSFLYMFWKKVGTPSGGGKTVTITPGVNSNIEIAIAEFSTGGSPTWAVDGTPTKAENITSTDPTPGSITTTQTSGLVVGITMHTVIAITAAAGYTKRATMNILRNTDIEDQIVTSAGSYTPSWTMASGVWSAGGVAFKAT